MDRTTRPRSRPSRAPRSRAAPRRSSARSGGQSRVLRAQRFEASWTPPALRTLDRCADLAPRSTANAILVTRSEEHTSELQSRLHLVCRLLLEKKKIILNHSPLHRHYLSVKSRF